MPWPTNEPARYGGRTGRGERPLGSLSEEQLWEAAPGTVCQLREIKGPSGRKKEGIEGQSATYGGSLGLLPKGTFIWEHLDLPLGSSRFRST